MAGKKLQNGETKNQLLLCAKEEFMQKGFMKASLRNICKQAGVKTFGGCLKGTSLL